jgi:hypothetical protein
MPLWTEMELEIIAPCFATVVDWCARLTILGGIPRHGLASTKYDPTKYVINANSTIASRELG